MNQIARAMTNEFILRQTDAFALGVVANVLVTRWRSPSTVEGLQWVRKAAEKILEDNAQYATLTLISPLPSLTMGDDAYSEVERMKDDFRGRRVAAAYVVEVKGLAGAVLSEVLRGLMVGNRNDCPTRVFHDARDAAAWLAPYCSGIDADDLVTFTHLFS